MYTGFYLGGMGARGRDNTSQFCKHEIPQQKNPTKNFFFLIVQKNTGQNAGKPRLDLNVEAAWAQVGHTLTKITVIHVKCTHCWKVVKSHIIISFGNVA
jgi:hypothetical protein